MPLLPHQPEPRSRRLRRGLALGVALVWTAGLGALEPPVPPAEAVDDELRLSGVFESALPGTEKKNRLKLILRPRLGDLHRRDHVRMPIGLRYGLTERWEVTGTAETYFAHGLADEAAFNHAGIASLHFGTKYRIGERLWSRWDAAVGFDHVEPVGSPPADVSDRVRHMSYFVTFSRHLDSRPDVRVFWGVSAHHPSALRGPQVLDDNELGDDSVALTGGFVWNRGALHYTFEAVLASTRWIGDLERDVLTLRPGIVWLVPSRYMWNARSQWTVGMGPTVSIGPEGTDVGASAKVRASFDFKRWWRQTFGGGKKS